MAVRIVYHNGQTPERLSRLLDAHERARREREGVLKDGRRSIVTRVSFDGEELCVKEYRTPGALGRAKDFLRTPRAERAWQAAGQLASRGIATPEPVAVVQRGGVSYLVTRFVEGSAPLDRLLRERPARSADEVAAKRRLVRSLGRWFQRIHASGIYQGDCSAKNVLVVDSEAGWLFHLLDLDGWTPRRRLTDRRRVKNLSQLVDPPGNLTRTDCMRLLGAYAEGVPALEKRRFVRDVAAAVRRRSARRARVYARRGWAQQRPAAAGAPILHLFSNWRWTGPAEPALNLAAALHGPDWQVSFACGREPPGMEDGPSSVLRRARERGVPTRSGLWLRKHGHLLPTWRDARQVRDWLARDRFAVIHCHGRNAHVVGALAARGSAERPLLVRSCYAPDGPRGFRERRLLAHSTDGLILVSERARRRAIEELGFPAERTWVVDGAIDLDRFDPQRVRGGRRADLGIADSAFVVGIVARVQWRRRFDVFLEAIDRARHRIPELRALIVGRGTNLQAIAVDPIRKRGLENVVVLPGYHTGDDFVRTVACMDVKVYMVPGTDGSCRAVREALAMGVPVVAPSLGPLPELIGNDERGLLMQGSVEDLVRCLVTLAEQPTLRDAMAQRARQFALERFSLVRQAEQVGRIYRELMT